MKLDQSHIFESKENNIKLIATEFDESNNGNTHWKFQFFMNEKLIDNQYLNYSYGGLFPKLEEFVMQSNDGNYIYIPQSMNSVLYSVGKKHFFEFKSLDSIRNNDYLKNLFVENKLVIVHNRSFQILNLDNLTIQEVVFKLDELKIIDVFFNSEDGLKVEYKSLKDYGIYKKRYDFMNLQLID